MNTQQWASTYSPVRSARSAAGLEDGVDLGEPGDDVGDVLDDMGVDDVIELLFAADTVLQRAFAPDDIDRNDAIEVEAGSGVFLPERIGVGMVGIDDPAVGFPDDRRRQRTDLHADHVPQVEAADQLAMTRADAGQRAALRLPVQLIVLAAGSKCPDLDGRADVRIPPAR